MSIDFEDFIFPNKNNNSYLNVCRIGDTARGESN